MAKNRWYEKKEDAFVKRRARQLNLIRLPYGRRTIAYRKIAGELYREFGIRRTWQAVQQRIRITRKEEKNEPKP